MSRHVAIVTIQGIPDAFTSGAAAKLCYPRVPNYGSLGNYFPVLLDRPGGVGARWDVVGGTASTGQLELLVSDETTWGGLTLPVAWWARTPRPVTEIDPEGTDASAATTTISLLHDPANIPELAIGRYIWIGTETLRVTAHVGLTIIVARAQAGSVAVAHPRGSDIYARPPSLIGRIVTISEVDDSTATSSAAEVAIMRGYVASDPVGRNRGFAISVNTASLNARMNDRADWVVFGASVDADGQPYPSIGGGAPRFGDGTRGYYWIPRWGLVLERYVVDGVSRVEPSALHGDWGDITDFSALAEPNQEAWEIIWTGAGQHPYGYDDGSFVPSRHPVDIALNHILSTPAGTNETGGASWDLGTILAPDHALGVPVAYVDVAAWVALRDGPLAEAEADDLWYGGSRRETYASFFRRLLGPLGVGVGVGSDGVWRPLALRDVYLGGDTVALTNAELQDPEQWTQDAVSRPADVVEMVSQRGPVGRDEGYPIVSPELDGASLYPRADGVRVGGVEVIDDIPYLSEHWDGGQSWGVRLQNRRMRRLAARVPVVTVRVQGSGDIDLGSPVTLHAPGLLRDPRTGAIQAEADAPLRGIVAEYSPIAGRRAARVTVVQTDTDARVARIGPGATVTSYAHGTYTLTVEEDDHSETGDDATTFEAGQVVDLLSSTGVLRSRVASAVIDSVTTDTIVLEDHWQDEAGDMDGQSGRSAPAAGDYVVLARYDETRADDQAIYAWGAGVGTAGALPTLGVGNEEPYRYGD